MARSDPPRPTEAELSILRVLWEHGPSTVRDVYETLSRSRRTGYTTALKLMQIMHDKGLVSRDERRHAHVYQAARSEGQTQKFLLRDLLDRAFGGSAPRLIMGALAAKKISPDELREIRKLLDQLEGGPQ